MKSPIKMDDLGIFGGYHYFRKHPNILVSLDSDIWSPKLSTYFASRWPSRCATLTMDISCSNVSPLCLRNEMEHWLFEKLRAPQHSMKMSESDAVAAPAR